jgi:hypothetical protein
VACQRERLRSTAADFSPASWKSHQHATHTVAPVCGRACSELFPARSEPWTLLVVLRDAPSSGMSGSSCGRKSGRPPRLRWRLRRLFTYACGRVLDSPILQHAIRGAATRNRLMFQQGEVKQITCHRKLCCGLTRPRRGPSSSSEGACGHCSQGTVGGRCTDELICWIARARNASSEGN